MIRAFLPKMVLLFLLGGVGSSFAQTALDTLLQGKEYKLPPLDSSYRSKASAYQFDDSSSGQQATTSKQLYVIQFDALPDFDAAQSRRAELQRRTGMAIQLVFDSPFYKLRAGGWTKKEDAEDMVRNLADSKIQAFVVKAVR
ncbi:MAG TPA: SPOR domain-containing protein [Fibrobacteraceae bacterium]|nr:SPOR domain-containing protein [Fibrobacteraceae bacterium]